MFSVRHKSDPDGEEFRTPGQALRTVARFIRNTRLTPDQTAAFEAWYTPANYRMASQRLRCSTRYEFAFSINGTRQAYVIEPLPQMPQYPVARVILHAQDRAETPRIPRE